MFGNSIVRSNKSRFIYRFVHSVNRLFWATYSWIWDILWESRVHLDSICTIIYSTWFHFHRSSPAPAYDLVICLRVSRIACVFLMYYHPLKINGTSLSVLAPRLLDRLRPRKRITFWAYHSTYKTSVFLCMQLGYLIKKLRYLNLFIVSIFIIRSIVDKSISLLIIHCV